MTVVMPTDMNRITVTGDQPRMRFSPWQRFCLMVFLALAVFFIVAMMVGAFTYYSPVPRWDMWNGTIAFYFKIEDGDYGAWLGQHNEHRIILSRLLFWLDLTFFGGTAKFLVACNYLLAAFSYAVLWLFLSAMLHRREDSFARLILGCVMACLMFSWIQADNLIWGFQSQFILAQNLPLLGCYWLYKASLPEKHSQRYFVGAVLMGLLSAGNLISGILALPVLMLLALLLRLSWQRIFLLALISAGMLCSWFHGYVSTPGTGYLTTAFIEQPFNVIRFLLMYMGAPLGYTEPGTMPMAMMAGLIVILLSGAFAARTIFQRFTAISGLPSTKSDPSLQSLRLALVAFIFYVVVGALGTAAGRLLLGVEAAFSSRYMTPVLTAWSALLILIAPWVAGQIRRGARFLFVALLTLPIMLVPFQCSALTVQSAAYFQYMVAALALTLGVNDESQIRLVANNVPSTLAIAERARAENLSIFAQPELKDAAQSIGQVMPAMGLPPCIGNIEMITLLQDSGYVKVDGWLFAPFRDGGAPRRLRVLDQQRQVVGYGITGKPRPDLAKVIHQHAYLSGFSAYMQSNHYQDENLIFSALDPACEFLKTGVKSSLRFDSKADAVTR